MGGLLSAQETEPRRVHANDPESTRAFGNNAVSNTKYTWYNFVLYNLLEQFSRPMNVYFLLIACLQLIRTITPVDPLTTWVPLGVVFAITAVKEGVDDYYRWRADREANRRPVTVLRGGQEKTVLAGEVVVGDLVKVHENEEIPCDLVVLATSEEGGGVFIQTTNLDGESNLKGRIAPAATASMHTMGELSAWGGEVMCPPPDEHLDAFDAQLLPTRGAASTEAVPLTPENLLLQATHVRNTEWAVGVAVYVGNATKFGKNKKTPAPKFTRADDSINELSVYIFLFQLTLVIILGVLGNQWKEQWGRDAWYLDYLPAGDEPSYQTIIIPARFLLLNSTMIPISLKVTLDLCKLFYSRFIDADVALYDEASDCPARSNSTALAEDLGQVEYVLTDKTGTLTQNVMALKYLTVAGTAYGAGTAADGASGASPDVSESREGFVDGRLASALKGGGADSPAIELLRSLALNNDVRPDAPTLEAGAAGSGSGAGGGAAGAGDRSPIPDEALQRNVTSLVYKASSPDEEAFVKGSRLYEVSLLRRDGGVDEQTVVLSERGRVVRYQQLLVFPFDSDRKRMSVLIKRPDGGVRLLCKGADDKLLSTAEPMLAARNPSRAAVQEQVNEWAARGLRTLVFAYRDLGAAEYRAWRERYDEAARRMKGRAEAVEATYAELERDLVLLGASAVEDKLQDRVPEVIATLRRANVRFWMCTGDKQSTAETIARTCRLLAEDAAGHTLPPRVIEGSTREEILASIAALREELERDGYELRRLPPPRKYIPSFVGAAWCGTRGVGAASAEVASGSRGVEGGDVGGAAGPAVDASDVSVVMAGAAIGGAGAGVSSGGASGTRSSSGSSSRRGGRRGQGAKKPFVIIIKGDPSIRMALEHAREEFAQVALAARSVVCCRVTPKQKAELVRLVRDAGHVTLAIGDGGNDVSMIQEAQVGVGIRGKEGLQAARASDYQVGMFRALERLLLVHGHFSYYRTSLVAQYSFYKSFLFCFLQILYASQSGASGVSLFNSLTVAAYNAVLFVPIVFFFLDKDVEQDAAVRLPSFYLPGQSNALLNYATFGRDWLGRAVFQAFAIGVLVLFSSPYIPSAAYESLGLLVFMIYFFSQDVTMLSELTRITWWNLTTILGMHVIAVAVGIVTNNSSSFNSFIDRSSFNIVLQDPNNWLLCALCTVACIIPVIAVKLAWPWCFSSPMDAVRHYDVTHNTTPPLIPLPPACGGTPPQTDSSSTFLATSTGEATVRRHSGATTSSDRGKLGPGGAKERTLEMSERVPSTDRRTSASNGSILVGPAGPPLSPTSSPVSSVGSPLAESLRGSPIPLRAHRKAAVIGHSHLEQSVFVSNPVSGLSAHSSP